MTAAAKPNTLGPILVINPNSSEEVTEGLREALAGMSFPGGPVIECVTITDSRPAS